MIAVWLFFLAGAHKAFFRGEVAFPGNTVVVFPDFVHVLKRLKTLANNAMKAPIKMSIGGSINFVSLKNKWLLLRHDG